MENQNQNNVKDKTIIDVKTCAEDKEKLCAGAPLDLSVDLNFNANAKPEDIALLSQDSK